MPGSSDVPGDRDSGAATVWAAVAVAGLLVIGAVLWTLGSAAVLRQRAANAADLAALAAAGHADLGTTEACAHAERVAGRMAVRIRECRLERWDALVIVEATGPPLLARFGPATARARAGPVEDPAGLPVNAIPGDRSDRAPPTSSGRPSAVSGQRATGTPCLRPGDLPEAVRNLLRRTDRRPGFVTVNR